MKFKLVIDYALLFGIFGLRGITQFLRDFSMFNFGPSIKNFPSARHASTDYVVCRDFDTFNTKKKNSSHSCFMVTIGLSTLLYILFNTIF
jgi:hypothetical protein